MRIRTLAPLAALIALPLIGGLALNATAAVFVVNSSADTDDGACDPLPGDCTLREAANAATANAGLDTVRFDGSIFPEGVPTTIALGSALPSFTDPLGTTVDGTDASVVVDGSALAVGDGIVIQSGAGAALAEGTVRRITVQGFPRNGIVVCGGDAADCSEGLTNARVESAVAVANGWSGIRLDGAPHDGTLVIDSVVTGNGIHGITLNAGADALGEHTDLTDATITRCAASNNGTNGINVNAIEDNERATVNDSSAWGNGLHGINVNAAAFTVDPKVQQNVANGNDGSGININALDGLPGASVLHNVASDNGSRGILLNTGFTSTSRARIRQNFAVGNDGDGIRINDAERTVALGNMTHGNGANGLSVGAGPGRNRVLRNRASDNAADGIAVEDGSPNNRVRRNTALSNGGSDLADGNAACDANGWRANVYEASNQPCID